MRLIDADKLECVSATIPHEASDDYKQGYLDGFSYSFEIIDGQPTITIPQWIPVSERLPEIGEHNVSEPCIVYCSNGAYGFAELDENIFGQVGWNCERDDEYHEPLGEVLAWMPLPEPWEEVTE